MVGVLPRIIPILQIENGQLVKTERFKKRRYVGDPINAVKIFNEKEVDELMILDISATAHNRTPDFQMIEDVASEAFMPVCYGGGVTNVDQMRRIFYSGVEKIALNSAALDNPGLITEAAAIYGSQSVITGIDIKRNVFGSYRVYHPGRQKLLSIDPQKWVKEAVERGAGEILLTSVDREGTFRGYDLTLGKAMKPCVDVPVILNGGARDDHDLQMAIENGLAAAAGSMFVFHGPHRAVLIRYPKLDFLHSE